MKNSMVLLRTLLLSTSRWNVYRHSTDRKRRRKIIGGAVGEAVLGVMLVGLGVAVCAGYGQMGLIRAVPEMCALTISALAFVLTLLKTNGYLFNFREYDMLMALPFETRTVAATRFLYMFLKSLPWMMGFSVALLAGYGWFARPGIWVYPLWIALSLILPVIPMVAAAFLGFLIARVSAGFRRTNLIQTVLTMVFVLACFSLRFFIEAIFKDGRVEETLLTLSRATGGAARAYWPARWFADAITRGDGLAALLLAAVSAALFAAVFLVVGRSYRRIQSALRSHAAARRFRMTRQKRRSAVAAVAFKEFRRMTGSTTYMVNAGIGVILALLLGLVTLVVGVDRIIAVVTRNAPIDAAMLQPAIPFVVYFFTGMMATTACSPSLEGRNYWIVQSLPIGQRTLYRGKMLFNLLWVTPPTAFAILCLCLSARTPVADALLYLALGIALCAFSTAWGCVCGIRHMRLDWENEVEVIKQGAAVAIYLLPNMFVVMGLTVLVVVLGLRMDRRIVTAILTGIATVLAALSYRRAMRLADRR